VLANVGFSVRCWLMESLNLGGEWEFLVKKFTIYILLIILVWSLLCIKSICDAKLAMLGWWASPLLCHWSGVREEKPACVPWSGRHTPGACIAVPQGWFRRPRGNGRWRWGSPIQFHSSKHTIIPSDLVNPVQVKSHGTWTRVVPVASKDGDYSWC
jgi:hypothetical protein